MIKNISEQEFSEMQESTKLIIIDVRTKVEFDMGHLENAKNIDIYSPTFEEEINKLDKDKIYVIYCRSGARGMSALNMFEKLRFIDVYNLENGLMDCSSELVK